ncbi:MAG TPA: carboxypeptidase-like regulatory domain-containing protein [Saprospiraceae bacterium]|nr:carboxypeptidase-like regulatory domain-containing protein [Saprospiraceae bacterium]
MMPFRLFLVMMFSVFFGQLFGQLTGRVSDALGALPFASVYVEGTSQGTTTNNDGLYELKLEKGTYRVVFQFVGYHSVVRQVKYLGQPMKLDVQLKEADFTLPDVVVKADAEDPAYPIIREAMKKRKFYKNQVDTYSCRAYVKGVQKIEDAPQSIFGNKIGTMDGVLDSNRQGVVYFAESLSKLYYKAPDYKEIVEYVKVSGDDNGFGFNSATIMTFSLYNKTLGIGRDIISPIAPNAMNYYRFKLAGTVTGKDGKDVNKIKIIPKRSHDPTFSGFVYIRDDYWDIQGVDIWLTGKNIKQPILDTLRLKQNYLELQSPDLWMLQSQNMTYSLKLFGFEILGYFNGVVSDYQLGDTESVKWNQNVYIVEDGANDKDITFWDSIRPMPLTLEESTDYVRKDSLQKIWKSKTFLDSVDRKSNEFKLMNLLMGYTYSRSYHHQEFSISSPLNSIYFNSVQGTTYGLSGSYSKSWGDGEQSRIRIKLPVSYGLSEQKVRVSGKIEYRKDKKNYATLSLSGGQQVTQFNHSKPIGLILNELYSLLDKKNYMKLYEETFGRIGYSVRLNHGLNIALYSKFSERSPLVNHTNFSWRKKEALYISNTPLQPTRETPGFSKHRAFISGFHVAWTPKTEYSIYPSERVSLGSKYPTFSLDYRMGMPLSSAISFQTLTGAVEKRNVGLGVWGNFDFKVKGGLFLEKDSVGLMDYFHFGANQTWFAPYSGMNSFRLMPYYVYRTTEPFAEAHFEHHFKGFFLDKIPLIRKLGWNEAIGLAALYTQERGSYFELNAGLENMGFKAFRLLRVDVVSAFAKGAYLQTGVTVGIGF